MEHIEQRLQIYPLYGSKINNLFTGMENANIVHGKCMMRKIGKSVCWKYQMFKEIILNVATLYVANEEAFEKFQFITGSGQIL